MRNEAVLSLIISTLPEEPRARLCVFTTQGPQYFVFLRQDGWSREKLEPARLAAFLLDQL